MIGRIGAVLAAVVIAVAATAGPAAAQPPQSSPGSGPGVDSAATVPANFPPDLRQFIGGTTEFKQATWFHGDCATRGGDMGAYLGAMLTNENRLLWWSMSDAQKKAFLTAQLPGGAIDSGSNVQSQQEADQMVANGGEPPANLLPRVFPAGDPNYHPPTGVCADDLKAWASPSSNTWGFDWATPDISSVNAMKTLPGGISVPEQAWTDPCSFPDLGVYCGHAFFVDCDKADNNAAGTPSLDAAKCRAWNASIGHLFAGTANWVEKNTSASDQVAAVLGAVIKSTPIWQGGKWVTSALSGIASVAGQVVKFVENPQGAVDDWANAIKQGSIDISTRILKSLAGTQHFDPGSGWFRQIYSVSVALGIILSAFLLVFAVRRGSSKGSARELALSVFGYLPLSFFLALFAPGFAALTLDVSTSLSANLAQLGGPTSGDLINHVIGFDSATSVNFPGGSLLGIVMFGLLMLGALMVWIGLMVHDFGLPLAGIVSGISLFMLVHPKYRHKALRPVYVFFGLAFSGPVLFLLLWGMFAAANAVYGSTPSSGLGQAGEVFQVALAMAIVGLAPWGLLKWAPILPTASDSEDIGQGSSVLGDVIGGAGNAMIFAHGGGVGGDQPAARTDTDSGSDKSTGTSSSSDGAAAGEPNNPISRTYQEKSSEQQPAQGGAAHAPAAAKTSGEETIGAAAKTAGTAGAEGGAAAASGGATIAAAIGLEAVSAAVNKTKSIGDDAAPRADDDNP